MTDKMDLIMANYGPNKLECYITLVLKGLPGTNATALLAHS